MMRSRMRKYAQLCVTTTNMRRPKHKIERNETRRSFGIDEFQRLQSPRIQRLGVQRLCALLRHEELRSRIHGWPGLESKQGSPQEARRL